MVRCRGLLWLVALALVGSFISLYYYLIVLKKIFLDESDPLTNKYPASPGSVRFSEVTAITILATIVLLLGITPEPVVSRILSSLS